MQKSQFLCFLFFFYSVHINHFSSFISCCKNLCKESLQKSQKKKLCLQCAHQSFFSFILYCKNLCTFFFRIRINVLLSFHIVRIYVLFFFFRIRINVLEFRFIICFIGKIMQRILLQYEMKEHDLHTNQTVSVKKKTTDTQKE